MKQLLLTITTLSSFGLASMAQPTIGASDIFQADDKIASFYDFSTEVSAGSGGANQTWDFSELIDEYSDTTEYLDASQTPTSSKYPDATVAIYDEDWDLYDYYIVNSNGAYSVNHSTEYTYYYFADDVEETYLFEGPYDSPHTLIEFPTTYNTTWNRTHVFTDTLQGGAYFDSVNAYHSVRDSVVADGYGTVITPAGTYPNALRLARYAVITKEHETKEAGTWNSAGPIVTYDTTYQWWVPGEAYPVLEIEQISASATGGGQSVPQNYAIYNQKVIATNIKKPLPYDAASAYPNPSSGSFFIRDADKVVSITNVSGAEISYDSFSFGNNSLKVDLQETNPGLYFVKVITNGQVKLTRITVTE